MNEATFKTIGEILTPSGGKQVRHIVIPNYQRGFKWAVQDWNGKTKELSAVEKLLNDLEMPCRNESDYFLQGITVQEKEDAIVLIDGQQRVTTMYLLLWYLGGPNAIADIDLQYEIREKSGDFLWSLKNIDRSQQAVFEPSAEDDQDVYYFKQAILQMGNFFEGRDELLGEMADYIKRQVKVIYITVDTVEKAVRTFTMMNGAKANMLDEELVKAEMLRLVSRPTSKNMVATTSLEGGLELLRDICAEDWETTALRSRYAREWDKWACWWNRADVRGFFNVETPMGLLLEYYFKQNSVKDKTRFDFDSFSKQFLRRGDTKETIQNTKHVFKSLRHLQKSFEDIYADFEVYNWLGLSLKSDGSNEKYEIVSYFIENKNEKEKLERYARCKMAGCTHAEITSEDKENVLCEKQEGFKNALLQPDAYHNAWLQCCKFLMYLNILEDNKLSRKFDFSIWGNKSLEHIFPKSRVFHVGENDVWYRGDNQKCTREEIAMIESGSEEWLARKEIVELAGCELTEHGIGNLVLLYGNNNSEFGNKSFSEKKEAYFMVSNDKDLRSRNLLHSVSKFANSDWRAKEIVDYYREITTQLNRLYEK